MTGQTGATAVLRHWCHWAAPSLTVYIFHALSMPSLYAKMRINTDKSNNLPNVLSFVTRYLVRRGDLRPCH